MKAAVLTHQNIVGLIAGKIIGAMFFHIGPRNLFTQGLSQRFITRIL
ncbi:MAG: hypothetical protein M0Q92_08385 [Methanoregula sp.]|nr:hypothetical protein [Methanoregula sp.]